MKKASTGWAWTIVGRGARHSGTLSATDIRGAASSLLMGFAEGSSMRGDYFGIPVEVLDEASRSNGEFEALYGEVFISIRDAGRPKPASRSMLELKALWSLLRDIPMVEDETLDAPFLHFSAGTHREAVWHWFEAQNPQFMVGEVQAGNWPQ